MKKPDSDKERELRRLAEERLHARQAKAPPPEKGEDPQRLLHELQVHQIELEMQNNELTAAREELEATLARYTELYDFAPVGYFTLGRDGIVRQSNITGATLLGTPRSRIIGTDFRRFLPTAERPAFGAFLTAVFETGKQRCELPLRSTDGPATHVKLEALSSLDGSKCRILVIDITERRAAEERSARRTRNLQILAGSLQEINSVLDVSVILRRLVAAAMVVTNSTSGAAGLMTDGKMVFAEYNEKGRTFPIDFSFVPGYGVPGQVMQTKQPYVSADAEHDAQVIPEIKKALGFHTLADVPIILRDGRLAGCFEIHNKRGGPFDDQDLDMLKGLAVGAAIALEHVQHVQDQKRVEDLLREAHGRLTATMDAIPDLLFVLDREGRIYDYHAPHSELLYVPPEQFIGRKMGDVLPEPAATVVRNAIAEAVAKGRHTGGIYSLDTSSGTRWFELSIAAQGDPGDPHGHLVLLAHNFTDRKRGEDELKQTAEDLRRSNRDLEQFAFVASHDLKEPLRMVTGFMDLLQLNCGNSIDAKGREYIAFAMEGGKRMQALIDDLLLYSRAGLHAATQPADMEEILKTVCENLKTDIDASGATLTHDPLPVLQGNPRELAQLLQNLIGNALKFRGAQPPAIHVGARHEDGQWRLSVSDNGIGFDPQFRNKIFVIFQRLHTRDKYPGTGIGLAVCKKIAERHGGTIDVESEPGKGSTFFFTIPDSGRR